MSGGCGGHGGGPTLPRRRASGQTAQYQPESHAANPALDVIVSAVLHTVLALVICAPLLIGLFIVLNVTGVI